jgi:RNA-binding protein
MLTAEGKRKLRSRAHHLKPVVLVGHNGLSDAVMNEVTRALDDHELIKIRFRGLDRHERASEIARVCDTLAAELVGNIGGTAILFRERADADVRRRSSS